MCFSVIIFFAVQYVWVYTNKYFCNEIGYILRNNIWFNVFTYVNVMKYVLLSLLTFM